jgi:outer membrane protein TolC
MVVGAVRRAGARIEQAQLYAKLAGAKLWPSVDLLARGGGKMSGDGSGLQGGLLTASWELDLFGENRRAAEAATYGLDAADESLRNTLLTLIGDVATYYVEARGYQARAALAKAAPELFSRERAPTQPQIAARELAADGPATAYARQVRWLSRGILRTRAAELVDPYELPEPPGDDAA